MPRGGGTDPEEGDVVGGGVGEGDPFIHGGGGEGPGEGGAEGEGVDDGDGFVGVGVLGEGGGKGVVVV